MKIPDTIIFEADSSFSVPSDIVDKYLDSPYDALRLILFLLRHASSSYIKRDITDSLNIDEQTLSDSLDYWIKLGILNRSGETLRIRRPSVKASDIAKYTPSEVSDRINGDSAIRFLYDRTETILARPLNTTDAYTVLSIVDWIGLPSDVAAMLLQYCEETDKRSMRQIEKAAVSWAEKGIVTYDKAEKFIAEEKEKHDAAYRTAKIIGVKNRRLTDDEKAAFSMWINDYGFSDEMISAAYDSMIKSIGGYKYQYMDKILKNWHEKGLKTPDETAAKSVKEPAKAPKKRYESTSNVDTEKSADIAWEIIKKTVEEDDPE